MALPWETNDGVVHNISRTRIVKVDDKGTQQLVNLKGRKYQQPEEVWHIQRFGDTAVPPKDGDGVLVSMGGRADRGLYFDAGHEKYRPKDMPEGSRAIFDMHGNIVSLVEAALTIRHSTKFSFVLGKGYDAGQWSPSTDGKEIGLTVTADGGAVLSYENVKITAKPGGEATLEASVKVVVLCPDVNLGGEGGKYVKLADGSNATKVKAV